MRRLEQLHAQCSSMRASMRLTAGCVTYSTIATFVKSPQPTAASNAKRALDWGASFAGFA